MKKLSKIKNIVCALGIVTLSVSCTDNYKEWNTNPYNYQYMRHSV